MKSYWVEVTYGFYIDAEDEEEAENWGWDHWISHPQTGESTQPHKSNAELSEKIAERGK